MADTAAGTETTTTDTTATTSVDPNTGTTVATPTLAGPDADPGAIWNDPAKAQAEILRLRKRDGDGRMAGKAALRSLAESMGVDPKDLTDTEATPQQLAAQLADVTTQKDGKIADLTKANAVLLEAWKAGVPADKANYLQFLLSQSADFQKLDTGASNFTASLSTLITGMVAADSTFTAAGGVKQSGLEQHGGSSSTTVTKEQFDQMGAAERSALYVSDRALYNSLKG